MSLKKVIFILCIMFFFVLNWMCLGWARVDTTYKTRYNDKGEEYKEGTKDVQLSADVNTIELIAAMVSYYVHVDQIPEHLGLKFYMERSVNVYLTVQELDYDYYYRLDKVVSPDLSTLSFSPQYKFFEWPTQNVIKNLKNFDIENLGAVARLGRSEPSMFWENVAPVIFYHSSQSNMSEKEYLFIFRTTSDAKLSCMLYKEEPGEDSLIKSICAGKRVAGGIWFPVVWEGAEAEKGYYQLKMKGFFLNNNRPINQTVRFYHNPEIE